MSRLPSASLLVPHRMALAAALLLAGAPAGAQTAFHVSTEELFDGTAAICKVEARSVIIADQLRRQGKTREEALALLSAGGDPSPASTLRLYSAMRENVEDVYDHRELYSVTLYGFRWAVCTRETLEAVRLPRLADVYPAVLECQRRGGSQVNDSACMGAIVSGMQARN